MTRFQIYKQTSSGLMHITSLEAETAEIAKESFCKSGMINDFERAGYIIDTRIDLYEDILQEEALRATCSLCVIEGRCVCGELDPLDEEEEEEMTELEIFMEENGIYYDDMQRDDIPREVSGL